MKKNFERFGYTATIVGDEGMSALLTIKNPTGRIIRQTEHKALINAVNAWHGWCSRHNLLVRPRTNDAVVIDINMPEPEEPAPVIEEPTPIIAQIANNLPLTAIIDFNFTNSLNLPLTEWIADINNRLKSGKYHPSEIVRIRLVPNA